MSEAMDDDAMVERLPSLADDWALASRLAPELEDSVADIVAEQCEKIP